MKSITPRSILVLAAIALLTVLASFPALHHIVRTSAFHAPLGFESTMAATMLWTTLGSFAIGILTGITTATLLTKSLYNASIKRLSRHMRTLAASTNLNLRLPKDVSGVASDLVESVNAILDTTEDTYLDMLQARYEAERANKGKSIFIAKVSHELRTPIHSITGMLRILLKEEKSPGKREYIQMARDSAHALLHTINEVLDYSKMQGGTLSLANEPFDLVATVRSSVEHLTPRFEEKTAVTFCWDVAPQIPKQLIGDAARVQNILVNLLGNAFKFTQEGTVTLRISSYDANHDDVVGINIEVQDSGIGIPADRLKHIFDPFTSASDVTARLYPGTGLGLAIVKQVVESMGGTVSVVSSPQKGSTFTVKLPLARYPNSSCDTYTPPTKKVAILGAPSPRMSLLSESLQRYGCSVSLLAIDEHDSITRMLGQIESNELIFIEKDNDTLLDELQPLIRKAAHNNTTVILSVRSSEIASMEMPRQSDYFFRALQPTSALDMLLVSAGALTPRTTFEPNDDIGVRSHNALRILVADDAQTNRIILKNLLEDAGHHVELVENGRELLERIMSTSPTLTGLNAPFDLVLTDIQMPIMDGITATQNFRKLEREITPDKKLPIVAVTSYAFPEECSKMIASGIDHIITKPISPKRLSNLLSQITCEIEYSDKESTKQQSDSEILEQLCKVADSVAQRVSDFTQDLQDICPILLNQSINISDVYERSGNSIKRTRLILNGFMDSYRPLLTDIEKTLDATSYPEELGRIVHSLKGLLLDVGAEAAARLGEGIERKLLIDKTPPSNPEIKEFVDAVRNTALIVQEVLSALPSLELYSALPATDIAASLH